MEKIEKKIGMKKNEKRGITISLILIFFGIIGLLYIFITKKDMVTYPAMYCWGIIYLVAGVILLIYFITLSKNKKISDEQENIYEDERLKNNSNKACAVTFKIFLWISVIADYVVAFFLEEYQILADYLSVFVGIMIIIYSMSYFFVSKRN